MDTPPAASAPPVPPAAITRQQEDTDDSNPYALQADGAAVDVGKFRNALRRDAQKMGVLEAHPQLKADVLDSDPAEFQSLLREARKMQQQMAEERAANMPHRSFEAQRASAPVPRDTVQLYEQLSQTGLQYGPAFRLLRNVHVPRATPS